MVSPEIIGRYALYGKIAAGGMATVHLGRLLGPVGFSRTVAIKRMHPQFTEDPEFVSMFLDEARLAARIRHPNVVPTLDVVATARELFLVLEYVQGETLARLLRQAKALNYRIPVPIVAAIASGMLHGLHAAHEAKNERGEPLDIVHRDVSPQNVMVGLDGVPRVLDFGIAKAIGRLQTTREGQLKGKVAYMSPEQIGGNVSTRRSDIYATSVVLWEALTGQRLFTGDSSGAILQQVLTMTIDPPSLFAPGVSPELDAIVLRGLAREPRARFASAREMASALEAAVHVAIAPAVGAWVERTAAEALTQQAAQVAEMEHASGDSGNGLGGTPEPVSGMAAVSPAAPPPSSASEGSRSPERSPPHDGTMSQLSQPSALSVSTPVVPMLGLGKRRGMVIGGGVVLGAVIIGVMALRSTDHAAPLPPTAASSSAASDTYVGVPTTPPAATTPIGAPTPLTMLAPPVPPTTAVVRAPTVTPGSPVTRSTPAGKRPPMDRPAPSGGLAPSTAPSPSAAAYNPYDHL